MNGALERILLNDLKMPTGRMGTDVRLDDAGFDSLAIVELSELLGERLGIDITDDEIKRTTTLGDLDRLIEQKRMEG